jgi:hypothetical protein
MSEIPPATAKAFETLAKSRPDAAKQWVKQVMAEAGPALPEATRVQLAEVLESGQKFERKSVSALFKATPVPGAMPSKMPVVHGTLTVERGGEPVPTEQNYRELPRLAQSEADPHHQRRPQAHPRQRQRQHQRDLQLHSRHRRDGVCGS